MVDLQQELEKRQIIWSKFIKSSFWLAGACAVIMLLLWIFLV
jgi:hypothetical protein